jgi:hypothetical protein
MAETLEIRLGGKVGDRPIAARDIDYSEIDPLIERLEKATAIESGLDEMPVSKRGKGRLHPLKTVRLALVAVESRLSKISAVVVYQFVVGAEIEKAVAKITAGLAGQRGNQLVPEAAHKVRHGLYRTIYRGLSVQLVNGVTTPEFSVSNLPPDLDKYPTRKFESEIIAKVLRVGGKKPAARVKILGSGQEATLELGGATAARELGTHLYRDAVLKGYGEWVIDPDRFYAPTRLVKFKVSSHQLLKPVDIDTVVDEMTEASGGIWDQVDPTKPIDDAD